MEKRVKITIAPSGSGSDLLTVDDAMQQVLDYFDLFRAADKSLDEKETIVWRLANVTTNIPLTVEAEPHVTDPNLNIEEVDKRASVVVKRFYEGMVAVLHKKDIPAWIENDKHIKSILKRNLNGIGRTDIDLGGNYEPLVISPKIATDAYENLNKRKHKKGEALYRNHYGSVEGTIWSVGHYYDKPCFDLRPRQGGANIRCIVSDEVVEEIGTTHSIIEVWKNMRVFVEGLISYNLHGEAESMQVKTITGIREKDISLNEIYDPEFTGELSVGEYQEKLRAGTLSD